MATRRRRQFVTGQVAWMLAVALVLVVLDALTYELFFVLSFVGFLIIVEITAPFAVSPGWRGRLRWVIVIGLVIFGVIVARRVISILPPGVV